MGGSTMGGSTMGGAGPERREQSFQLDYDAARDDKKSGVCQDGWVQVPPPSPSSPSASSPQSDVISALLAGRSEVHAIGQESSLLGSGGDRVQVIIISEDHNYHQLS